MAFPTILSRHLPKIEKEHLQFLKKHYVLTAIRAVIDGDRDAGLGVSHTSVSIIESLIANSVTNSDSDTDSTLSTSETTFY